MSNGLRDEREHIMDLKNKVVLITGAGKGMGRRLSEWLAERGAVIAANDISPVNVEEAVAGINGRGGKARAYIEDIAKKVGAQTVVKSVEDDFGTIDILIHHAAVEPHVSLLDMDEWDWHRTLDVNLTGGFLMIQSVGRVMKAKAGGVIICLGAGAGEKLEKEAGAYFASKAGLVELSHRADEELNPHRVQVRAVETFEEAVQILEEA
jgi:NAD(P)-dependent dehydrogenase (short-subunit alcohol dehydrogenase family)